MVVSDHWSRNREARRAQSIPCELPLAPFPNSLYFPWFAVYLGVGTKNRYGFGHSKSPKTNDRGRGGKNETPLNFR